MERRERPSDDLAPMVDGAADLRSRSAQAVSSTPDASDSSETPTLIGPAAESSAAIAGSSSRTPSESLFGDQPILQPGVILAQRYEILQLLGEGGMGAVYKAKDRELNRLVALKVIRPSLAGSQAIIDRFKQELVLAHQVTHRNVVRIYDLGEAEGMKFITMEYIDGENLHALIRERTKVSPEEAVQIMEQVCLALDAAHNVGVIHRDLKPQNIMKDKQGRVVVMDFGLARSMESDGMTQTGALIGTMEYMSPEQGLGKTLDARSDIFTLGLIFYELLTGKMPYRADSALASLVKRTHERAAPVSDHDAAIPRTLTAIVGKCLEPNPQHRYSSAKEILADLELWEAKGAAASLRFPSVKPWGQTVNWPLLGGIAAVLVIVAIGFFFRDKLFKARGNAATSGPVLSVAVLPFRNASGDQKLDWLGGSLADMLSTDIGESTHLRTVPPDRIRQILHDLRIAADTDFDNSLVVRVGEFSNADEVVSGRYAKFGDTVRIDATLRDLKHQRNVVLKEEAANDKDLLRAVARLGGSIQKNLSLPASEIEELKAGSFVPPSKSMEGLRYYTEGSELVRAGKHLEALKKFQSAIQEDPDFALAYSKLGETYAKLGYGDDAERSSQKAVELSENLQAQEKYRIVASHARIANNTEQAIQAYESLARIAPGDSDVRFNLAELYRAAGQYDKARDGYTALLSQDPRNSDALLGIGRAEVARGNAQKGLEYLGRALTLAVELDNQEQKAAALQATGSAYRDLNKPDDAIRSYQESLDIRRRLNDKGGIASSLDGIAVVQDQRLGKPEAALKTYQEVLRVRREIGDKQGIGDTLLNLGVLYERRGQYEEALRYYKDSLEIEREIGNSTREAQCLNNIGSRYLNSGEYEEALTYFQQALQLREKLKVDADISESLHNLAETSTKIGQFDQALGYYMRSLQLSRNAGDKLGEAIESHSLGTLFEYQGRYGAALKSKEDAVKIVRTIDDRFWQAAILSSYGDMLSEVGRYDEAQKTLDEALKLSRQVQSEPLIAQTLNFQGDLAYYRGDMRSAQSLSQQALQLAARSRDVYLVLLGKINVARSAMKLGQSVSAASALRAALRETEDRRLKYVSAQCSLYLGQALLDSRNSKAGQMELESAVRKSQTLGAQILLAQSHGALAKALRQTGDKAEALRQEEQASRILDAATKESQSSTLLVRSDLSSLVPSSHEPVAK